MNQYYNTTRAREILEGIQRESVAGSAQKIPHLANTEVGDVLFQQVEYPPSMRVMSKEEEEDDITEVVLKIQGVLCASTLPPYRRQPPNAATASSIRNLRQYVKITSLGAAGLDDAYGKLQDVQKQLQAQCKEERVIPLNFLPYEGYPCIETHARYFTDRNLVPFEKNIPFHESVDPNNILKNLKPELFIHGPDNRVDYIRRSEDKNGCARYATIDPASFKAGDLVEVAFSLVAVPIKEKRRLLYLNLKALTLIDDTIRKESERRAAHMTPPPTPVKIKSFKRRTVYVDWGHPEEEDRKKRKAETVGEGLDDQSAAGGEGSCGETDPLAGVAKGAAGPREEGKNMSMNVD
ncbi:hypothetical protein MD484_g4136, partial [Candolleomyces efflorescens]